jgi:hypothetical protein
MNNITSKTHHNRLRGLGDLVDSVMKKTGVKTAVQKVEQITNKKCKCQERQEALNRAFPFKPR